MRLTKLGIARDSIAKESRTLQSPYESLPHLVTLSEALIRILSNTINLVRP